MPIRQGGLGVFDPCKSSQDNYQFSTSVTSPLASATLNQLSCFDSSILQQQRALKQEALSIKRQNLSQRFSEFLSTLSNNLQLSLKLAGEKGASSWLSTLPLECHGFALHKGGFCDALALRYGWSPKNLSPYVQLTKMSVLAWTSRLLDSGVLGLNLLFLMLEYLTLM